MSFSRSTALLAALALAAMSVTAFAAAIGVQDSGHKYSYALTSKDGHSVMLDWDGTTGDPQFKKGGIDRLYVKKDGKIYLITDTATIAQVKQAFEPVMKIAKKQSAIGDRQSRIGGKQSKIGEQQSKLGEQMGELGSQMGELVGPGGSEAKREALQKKMDALQKQMDALGRQMDHPSKEQDALGKQQDELGRQQERAGAIAEKQVNQILDSAFAHGLAKSQ
jgi:hypothetical protein